MKMSAFSKLLALHTPRLSVRLLPVEIHRVEQDFVKLKNKYRDDECTRNSLDNANDETTSFEDGWKMLGSQVPWLRQFVGDLASTFPNTSTVESDFSVMGWEKDDYRQSLTDFSLEGVLLANQYKELQSITHVLGRFDSLSNARSEI
ncbi:hypothetical protein PF005_g22741 [Phytophthora fragariae]|uniref:HAT C-terminal dimerisation domain-containing protein n=1 Tax=Phytophthora fragariae TaxID=53985 RepID=A0A6A3RUI6_9STRA|nr:hypothetical protein PF010_g22317 [Phytophthora fragariae]KAE9080898.1 hypothetical protein PF007_g22861 [Phytophthora fragariae]KAE9103842.1 hypothetical protein PF006_g22066 [Phytophthora fragariae]KAE9181810.1 hypothetical protein PF005_g22741 [Phytophthora fragariae]KAE9193457.1 hypothetical protein PF002_g23906 [Phytophthora fragariae]